MIISLCAVARASDVGVTQTSIWAGQTIESADTLVMYTWGGDANLDGKLNVDDYIRIDQGIAAGQDGWSNGDFNYDGKVNIDDYTQFIDANIATQSGIFPTAGGLGAEMGAVAVPEPMALGGACGAVGLLLTARRRRRQVFRHNPPRGRIHGGSTRTR